ncbi:MAG: hypothetical protein RL522_480 [Pseudomonadota bacterium]|jgi:hypothetical protein
MKTTLLILSRVSLACALAGALSPALANDTPGKAEEKPEAPSLAFKYTASHYSNSNQPSGTDHNLRANYGSHVAWIGRYTQGGGAENDAMHQARAGYEYVMSTPFGQLTPSLQTASGGFWGGSLTAQIGSRSRYAIVGFGRSNLRPYYNLNFDPNDAVTLGMGMRLPDKALLSAFIVRDDRLSTGQTVGHLVWRKEFGDGQRVTVDLGRRHGRPDAQSAIVSGNMLSVGYDHRDVFVRITRDQKVNFSNNDQTRVAAGFRF